MQRDNNDLNLIEKGDKLSTFKNRNLYNSNTNGKTNCAFAAAVAGGAALAALGGGFMSGLGLATTELETLFTMAAEGATVAELWSAYVGMVGFWAAVGVGIGLIA